MTSSATPNPEDSVRELQQLIDKAIRLQQAARQAKTIYKRARKAAKKARKAARQAEKKLVKLQKQIKKKAPARKSPAKPAASAKPKKPARLAPPVAGPSNPVPPVSDAQLLPSEPKL